MPYFIGIDGGGTKTEVVLADEKGKICGTLRGKATNPATGGGVEQVLRHIADLVRRIMSEAGLKPDEPCFLFAGISGMGHPRLRQQGISFLKENFPRATVGWDHDGINALFSGTYGDPGGVLIAGTGSVAFALDSRGNRIRIGGWGHWLGDEGSGFAMGRLALRRIMEAWDGRGRETLLTSLVLSHWSLQSPEEIVSLLAGNEAKQRIASIVPLVFAAGRKNDAVALEVIEATAAEQAELIKALADRLLKVCEGRRIPIVLAGGMFREKEFFLPVIRERLSGIAHQVEFIIPVVPPVIGALAAALKMGSLSAEQIKRAAYLYWRGEKQDES